MASPAKKWVFRAALIPVAVVTYIAVAGLTGFCPNCRSIVHSVLGESDTPIAPGPAKGSIAELVAYDLEGNLVQLGQYVGKPLIIDVWATTCPPCRRQREVLHSLDAAFLESVNVVSLSVDTNPRVVTSFLAKHPSNVTELMASAEIQRAFGVFVIPTLVFVDSRGQIRDIGTGVHSANELKRRALALNVN